jgi:hypothetical protein
MNKPGAQTDFTFKGSNFPDPLASKSEKCSMEYGLKYAKAIVNQWGDTVDDTSFLRKRSKIFERNRRYAKGVQDTSIYMQLLTSLDPSNGDGSFLNLDFTPVPILPKFVRIVVNKILSKKPYPNVEAVDPFSSMEKDSFRRKIEIQIAAKEQLRQAAEKLGKSQKRIDEIPENMEEAEIFLGTNIKASSEIAAQIGTSITLEWNDFEDVVFRRAVEDLVTLGTAVVKRSNDPNYGITEEYVDPAKFIHSYTEDPNFTDIVYAGHIKSIPISELRRIAGGQLDEEALKKIAKKVARRYGYDFMKIDNVVYDNNVGRYKYGYDEFMVDILDFEFKSVDKMCFESKENKYGNAGFYYKGSDYKAPENSVFKRDVSSLDIEVIYGGSYVLGCDYVFSYGMKTNIPKNIHDITRAKMSYSVIATNIHNMIPKSMVDSCVGFADQLQLTHLKIQQAIAKAKPDGIIIDIEALENVQLGKGGELKPIELHDIYEQTGVFYYRSKNPEGGFQNPPIREIGNSIRNINEFIALYNHYLRMIRDTTGINEAMDGSTPKGEQLVGVREQAIAAGNNAIYDITNASMLLFKRVCEDIVKCLQVIPKESILYRVYENAIGKENMGLLTVFENLPMYNFGIKVEKEMDENEKAYLEQNIQISLAQKEIDLEDAMVIRRQKDVNLAERLLVIRRKKRIAMNQQIAMQNSQMQSQIQAQAAQVASQSKIQEEQVKAQIESQMMQMRHQLEMQKLQFEMEAKKEIEMIRVQGMLGMRSEEKDFKEKLEVLKEDRKDERVDKQAAAQSKLISQRQGARGELEEPKKEGEPDDIDLMLQNLM